MGVFDHKAEVAIGNLSKNGAIKLVQEGLKCDRGSVKLICDKFNTNPHQIAFEIYREKPEESEYFFFANSDYWENWAFTFHGECIEAGMNPDIEMLILKNGYVICKVHDTSNTENTEEETVDNQTQEKVQN